ncbi:hypothetical protein CEXT_652661 [Caerostris extrusa]|uniref:Uncharacterized protein n=1 Tax=Caerostris extrusa TaxID=172846 RepID=A0AAV4R754_CAEEX|nr:hypothetical protein CEXT_652661 [Caerostris extrusa]
MLLAAEKEGDLIGLVTLKLPQKNQVVNAIWVKSSLDCIGKVFRLQEFIGSSRSERLLPKVIVCAALSTSELSQKGEFPSKMNASKGSMFQLEGNLPIEEQQSPMTVEVFHLRKSRRHSTLAYKPRVTSPPH